jgi:hypothetical protein
LVEANWFNTEKLKLAPTGIRLGSLKRKAVATVWAIIERYITFMNLRCNSSSKLIGVLKYLNTKNLSTGFSNKRDIAATTFKTGITQLKSIVIQNMAMIRAYLSSMG